MQAFEAVHKLLVDSVSRGRFRFAPCLDLFHTIAHVMRFSLTVLVVKRACVVSATLSPNNGSFIFESTEIIFLICCLNSPPVCGLRIHEVINCEVRREL
jgi:hypothetical protein